MGNLQASLAARLESPETPVAAKPEAAEVEQPRDFHFAVTWFTLFAHLDLIESNGPCLASLGPRPQPASLQPAPILDLVPVTSAPLVDPGPPSEPGAGWEMVVPKMIRTGPGQFTPVDGRDA